MEGVIDSHVRDLLTRINEYDLCLTEFVRVTDRPVPKRTFFKIAPELYNKGLTQSGTPVRVQLLGQHPQWMAENAITASNLGSQGIDINFGCPAPTVNKSMGGASLLKTPDKIYDIVSAVKSAIEPMNQELSVKIRLGFDDTSLFNEIISAIKAASPHQLTIHARTKRQGYKAPAYWHFLGELYDLENIDVIANGEIWSKGDARACSEQAKTPHIMLGRGALATPNLASVIKYNSPPFSWKDTCSMLIEYGTCTRQNENTYYYSSRVKQWLKYLKLTYPQASVFFEKIKRESDKALIIGLLKQQ